MLFPNWGNQSIINYIAIVLARPSPYSSIDMVTEHRPRCMGHHLVLAHPFLPIDVAARPDRAVKVTNNLEIYTRVKVLENFRL